MKRRWYQADPEQIKEMAKQMAEEHVAASQGAGPSHPRNRKPSNYTAPFSEFESRFGRHADPLFSRHETTPRPSGLDPTDQDYLFVDAHVMATPTIADTDGDGVQNELVVPVSYFFDPYRYGNADQMDLLNGLDEFELADYVAAGVVVLDLDSGRVRGQRMLGITRGVDSQPGYLLAPPTVARLAEGEEPVIVVGSAMGEFHVMNAGTLREREGFPLIVDSITAQVGVADLFGHGKLDLLVGDASGNLYCVDGTGKRVWERELDNPVGSGVRLADVEGDGLLEVLVVTRSGDFWVLNGQTGRDHTPMRYPVHLNSAVETSALPLHLRTMGGGASNASLAVVVPTVSAIYIVQVGTGCVFTVDTGDYVVHEVVSGDVDPYSPGLELLALGLDGTVTCFKVPALGPNMEVEVWSMQETGQSAFVHRGSGFYFTLPDANVSQEIAGTNFDLALTLHSRNYLTQREFALDITIGREHVLLHDTLRVEQRTTDMTLRVPTPPSPAHSFLTVRVCDQHLQCQVRSLHLSFNLHAEQHLKWFLCFPFLCVCCLLLWIHRDHASTALPTTAPTVTRKDL